jgi:2-keto-4-pentenoate hydratase/2-oxohepta-3-ene-1,7-dioic acid hydratase in catechol pathway
LSAGAPPYTGPVKLLAYVPRNAPPGSSGTRLGLLTDGGIRDLTSATGAHDVGELLAAGGSVSEADAGELIDPDTAMRRAPIARPGKIICVGLNYHDHCREQEVEPPPYPPLFAKFANAIASPGDPITRPRVTEKLDLECELAVVIGRRASHIGRHEALDHVFGYTILNDITMRDLQREDHRWLRAKGSDGFAPIGPVVVSADELTDTTALRLRSSVNGETWQDSSTAEMIFDVPTIIAFASRTITLEPGDLIATGTPAGVGHFQRPPRYLHQGDQLRCEVEGIGALENSVVDELPRADDHAAAAGVAELMELAR